MSGILIADDEAIVRSALKRTLAQRMADLGPIYEASSGEEAVSLASQMCPSIVLMDIKMPGLSGLEAARSIRSHCPAAKLIMLTAYEEFSFSREALRLGAVDYLLKPVRPAVLYEVLQRVLQQIREEDQHRIAVEETSNLLRETLPLIETQLVRDLLQRAAGSDADVQSVLRRLGKTITAPAVVVVSIDDFEAAFADLEPNRREHFDRLLLDIVRHVLPAQSLVGQVRSGVVAVIVATDPLKADLQDLRALGHTIRYAIESSAPVTATIGIGHPYPDLSGVPASYAEALAAESGKSHFSANSVIHIADVPEGGQPGQAYPVEMERDLMRAVQLGRPQDAERILGQLADHLLAQPQQPPEVAATRLIELMALVSRAVIEVGAPAAEVLELTHRQTAALRPLATAHDIRAWALESLAALLTREQGTDRSDRVVSQALQYMRENLSRPGMELKDVARAVNLSKSHLAHLLKAKHGISYTQYLTLLRIDEARMLLATTDLTIAAISVAVGYEDATYFHRLFRRETAMTPAAYRQLLRMGEIPSPTAAKYGTTDAVE